VSGFLNADGGMLLIGVRDDSMVLGLDADFGTLKEKPNRDGFELTLQQILSNAIGMENLRYVAIDFCDVEGKELCAVRISRAQKPILISESTPSGRQDSFYVRIGNATKPLNVRDALAYQKDHWGI
jgi:predicted HTH transcriptional regulator